MVYKCIIEIFNSNMLCDGIMVWGCSFLFLVRKYNYLMDFKNLYFKIINYNCNIIYFFKIDIIMDFVFLIFNFLIVWKIKFV